MNTHKRSQYTPNEKKDTELQRNDSTDLYNETVHTNLKYNHQSKRRNIEGTTRI